MAALGLTTTERKDGVESRRTDTPSLARLFFVFCLLDDVARFCLRDVSQMTAPPRFRGFNSPGISRKRSSYNLLNQGTSQGGARVWELTSRETVCWICQLFRVVVGAVQELTEASGCACGGSLTMQSSQNTYLFFCEDLRSENSQQ